MNQKQVKAGTHESQKTGRETKEPVHLAYESPWNLEVSLTSKNPWGDGTLKSLATRLVLIESEKGMAGWRNAYHQWIRNERGSLKDLENKKIELKKEALKYWFKNLEMPNHQDKTYKPLWEWISHAQESLYKVWNAIWLECLLDMLGEWHENPRRIQKIEKAMNDMNIIIDWKQWEESCIEDLKRMENKEYQQWLETGNLDLQNLKERSMWQRHQDKKVLPFLGIQALLDVKTNRSPKEKSEAEQQWFDCVWVEWSEIIRRRVDLKGIKPQWDMENGMEFLTKKITPASENQEDKEKAQKERKKIEWKMKKVEFRVQEYEKMRDFEKRLAPNDGARWLAWWQEQELKATLNQAPLQDPQEEKINKPVKGLKKRL